MLQPKIYIKELNIVREVEMIDFYNKVVLARLIGVRPRGETTIYSFDEVEFMENTGFKDINGDYIYVGSILTDEGVLGDDYWDYATIEKDINDGYCISWKNNEFSESLYECSAYSVVGNIYENKELVE